VAIWLEIKAGLILGTLVYKGYKNTHFEFVPHAANNGHFIHDITGFATELRLQLCPLEDWLTYIHTGRVAPIHGPEAELPQMEPEPLTSSSAMRPLWEPLTPVMKPSLNAFS